MEQMPLIGHKEKKKEDAHNATKNEERHRLKEVYGEDAENAPLTKGEAVARKERRQRELQKNLDRLAAAIGVKRKGRSDENSPELPLSR